MKAHEQTMKLIIAIVQDSDVDRILDALAQSGIGATQITSAGGYLREPNITLFVGVEESQIEDAVAIIDANSNARRAFVNPLMPFAPLPESEHFSGDSTSVRVGASVFVLNVERFVRLTE